MTLARRKGAGYNFGVMHMNALTIAASDPSGGAGIEADLKVFNAHRVFGLTAITAITIQDSRGAHSVHPTDPGVFQRILGRLRDDQPLGAIKIGALATAAHLEAVVDFLMSLSPRPPVVLDPVISATSGAELLEADAVELIRDSMLPLVSIITPNLFEAGELVGREVADVGSMRRAAESLCILGAEAALVKGGHLKADSRDVLCHRGRISERVNDRIPHEFHGSGCVLAAAIAANLARDREVPEAVDRARAYLRLCMTRSRPGRGPAYILDFPPATDLNR